MFSLLSLISLEVIFPLVNGSVQLAGALSGVSDAEDVGVAGLCLCLRSPWQLFCCKSNLFSIKHFVPASLSSKLFPFITDSMCGPCSRYHDGTTISFSKKFLSNKSCVIHMGTSHRKFLILVFLIILPSPHVLLRCQLHRYCSSSVSRNFIQSARA